MSYTGGAVKCALDLAAGKLAKESYATIDPVELMALTAGPACEGISDSIRRLFGHFKKEAAGERSLRPAKTAEKKTPVTAEDVRLRWPRELREKVAKEAMAEVKTVLNRLPASAHKAFVPTWVSNRTAYDESYSDFCDDGCTLPHSLEKFDYKSRPCFELLLVDFDIWELADAYGIGGRDVMDHTDASRAMNQAFDAIYNIGKALEAKYQNCCIEYDGDWDEGSFCLYLS